MDPTTVAATIGGTASIIAAWLANRAAKRAKPVSNGFTGDVIRRLDNIETLLVDHVTHHPN